MEKLIGNGYRTTNVFCKKVVTNWNFSSVLKLGGTYVIYSLATFTPLNLIRFVCWCSLIRHGLGIAYSIRLMSPWQLPRFNCKSDEMVSCNSVWEIRAENIGGLSMSSGELSQHTISSIITWSCLSLVMFSDKMIYPYGMPHRSTLNGYSGSEFSFVW